MKERLLVSDRCKHCDEVKTYLKEDIQSGKIELLDIEKNKEAKELARIFGGVPTMIGEFCSIKDGKEECELQEIVLKK